VEAIFEYRAFGLENLSARQNVYLRQGWEKELWGVAKQVCGDGDGV